MSPLIIYFYNDLINNCFVYSYSDNANVPFFLPPVSFSRIDSVQNNIFKKDAGENNANNNIIGVTRMRRGTQAKYVNFDLKDPLPQKPNEMALKLMEVKMISLDKYELIKEVSLTNTIHNHADE